MSGGGEGAEAGARLRCLVLRGAASLRPFVMHLPCNRWGQLRGEGSGQGAAERGGAQWPGWACCGGVAAIQRAVHANCTTLLLRGAIIPTRAQLRAAARWWGRRQQHQRGGLGPASQPAAHQPHWTPRPRCQAASRLGGAASRPSPLQPLRPLSGCHRRRVDTGNEMALCAARVLMHWRRRCRSGGARHAEAGGASAPPSAIASLPEASQPGTRRLDTPLGVAAGAAPCARPQPVAGWSARHQQRLWSAPAGPRARRRRHTVSAPLLLATTPASGLRRRPQAQPVPLHPLTAPRRGGQWAAGSRPKPSAPAPHPAAS